MVSPTTRDELSIAADGGRLLYRANADRATTLTLVQDAASVSHQFSLRGIGRYASQTITLTNDVSMGRLAFANSLRASNSHDLAITMNDIGRRRLLARACRMLSLFCALLIYPFGAGVARADEPSPRRPAAPTWRLRLPP